jgi:hypothetical protein
MKVTLKNNEVEALEDNGFRRWSGYGYTRLYIAPTKLGYSSKCKDKCYIEMSFDEDEGAWIGELVSDDNELMGKEAEQLIASVLEQVRVTEAPEAEAEDEAEINDEATRENYEHFCEACDTHRVITIEDDRRHFQAVDDGTWYEYCVKSAKDLLGMDWTPEEREDWEDEYGIFGVTAERIEELMREYAAKEAE